MLQRQDLAVLQWMEGRRCKPPSIRLFIACPGAKRRFSPLLNECWEGKSHRGLKKSSKVRERPVLLEVTFRAVGKEAASSSKSQPGRQVVFIN